MTIVAERITQPPLNEAAPFSDVDSLLDSLLDIGNFRPVKVAEVELTHGLRRLHGQAADWSEYRLVLVVVELHSQPLGLTVLDPGVEDPEHQWTAELTKTLGGALESHLLEDSSERTSRTTIPDLWNGWADERPPCLAARRAAIEAAPPVTVVVATRERPELLVRCLHSLLRMEYPDFEVIVVDNAPETDRTYKAVTGFETPTNRVHYVRADRRGLGAAHNQALEEARGDIIAFTDDDVVVDRHWLAELVSPFVADKKVAGATGLILPAELETEAQVLLEAHGRYIKGYEPRLFDLNGNRPADPLFPFTAGTLGAGANMAFEADFLRRIGGFDAALGTGTIARGGDDLAALFQLVMSGRTLAYRPGAIVWHHHRRDVASVRRQTHDYAVGFGAYLTSAVVHNPKAVAGLLRRLPAGLSLLRTRDVNRRAEHWPSSLERLAHRGLLVGPLAYAASRARGARCPTWAQLPTTPRMRFGRP
jgi:GT2 family glycosyltransferase